MIALDELAVPSQHFSAVFRCFVTEPVYDPRSPASAASQRRDLNTKGSAIQTRRGVYSANSLCIVPEQLHDHPV